jgi:hypothetical protein
MIKIIIRGKPELHCYKYDAGCIACHMDGTAFKHQLLLDEVQVWPASFSADGYEKDGFICQEHIDKCSTDQQFEVLDTRS